MDGFSQDLAIHSFLGIMSYHLYGPEGTDARRLEKIREEFERQLPEITEKARMTVKTYSRV